MFNITNYQGNANQNHSEVPLHTFQNGYHQKRQKIKNIAETMEIGELLCTVDGNFKLVWPL